MLNSYTSVSQNNSKHITEVEADQRVSLSKTKEKSRIIRLKEGSEELKYLLSTEPFLLDNKKVVREKPSEYSIWPGDTRRWHQTVKTYLTHGVDVIQVQTNNDWVYVEYVDRECESKLYSEETQHHYTEPSWDGGEE